MDLIHAYKIAHAQDMKVSDEAKQIIHDITENEGYCPCRVGKKAEHYCPCEMFLKHKTCICGLFIKE